MPLAAIFIKRHASLARLQPALMPEGNGGRGEVACMLALMWGRFAAIAGYDRHEERNFCDPFGGRPERREQRRKARATIRLVARACWAKPPPFIKNHANLALRQPTLMPRDNAGARI